MLSYKLKKYLCNHICNVPYYFKFQTFYTIIDIKYINIFVFQLHIFLNVPIDIPDSRWSYLMEFHCLWYCGEITCDDFLKNGYAWFLNSRHFYFSFFSEIEVMRDFALVILPSLATDASADCLIAPPMSSAGPFPWAAFRKFRDVK